MTIEQMSAKFANNANIKGCALEKVVSGNTGDETITSGSIGKITAATTKGYRDARFGANAVFVLMQACTEDDKGKLVDSNNALQVFLSMFDRAVAPYIKLDDGTVVRDETQPVVRAAGTVVDSWKTAANAATFIQDNMDKAMKFTLLQTVDTRSWDNNANAYSKTDLRKQNVYKIDWV